MRLTKEIIKAHLNKAVDELRYVNGEFPLNFGKITFEITIEKHEPKLVSSFYQTHRSIEL